MRFKNLIILLSLVFTTTVSFSQEEQGGGGFDKSKMFFGGNFGVSFGNSTFVNVSPLAGYRFNSWLAAGAGINFIYSSFTTRDYNGDKLYRDEYGTAGTYIFGRVYPVQFAFLQVQPEFNYTWGKTKFYYGNIPDLKLEGAYVPSLLVGAGAALPAGSGAIILMIQYDVIQDGRSPYGRNPFFTIGFNF